eukprot:scaffold2.g6967.t1
MQGALGLSSLTDAYEPEAISQSSLPPDVAAVGAGHFHSFAVTPGGELWSWGRGKEGQLGRPLAPGEFDCSPVPGRVVHGLEGVRVGAATGSGVASLAVADNGRLLAWGQSKRGQLGLGAGVAAAPAPTPVAGLSAPVVQAVAGWGHAAALLADGSVFTWGWPAGGRLGHSHAREAGDEEEGALAARCVWQPARVELLSGVEVVQVACGLDHTLALAADGTLFSFGDNSLQQLGRPSPAQGEALVPPDASAWVVAAGLGHCLGVMRDGTLTSWGWNSAGQCGQGVGMAEECVGTPQHVYGISHLTRNTLIAAGRLHSVLATEEDAEAIFEQHEGGGRPGPVTTVHCWGSARSGRIGSGHGSHECSPFPELVADIEEEEVLELACGLDHTLALVRQEQPEEVLELCSGYAADYPRDGRLRRIGTYVDEQEAKRVVDLLRLKSAIDDGTPLKDAVLHLSLEEYRKDDWTLTYLRSRTLEKVWDTLVAKGSAGVQQQPSEGGESSEEEEGSGDEELLSSEEEEEEEEASGGSGASEGQEDGEEEEEEDGASEEADEEEEEEEPSSDSEPAALRREAHKLPARRQPPRNTKSIAAVVAANFRAATAAPPAAASVARRTQQERERRAQAERARRAAQQERRHAALRAAQRGQEERGGGARRRKRPHPTHAAAGDDDGAGRGPRRQRSTQDLQLSSEHSVPATPAAAPGARAAPLGSPGMFKVVKFAPVPRHEKCGACKHCLNPQRHKPCLETRRAQLASQEQRHRTAEAAGAAGAAGAAAGGMGAASGAAPDAPGVPGSPGGRHYTQRTIIFKPLKPEERCGVCAHCLNPQRKRPCIEGRRRQEEEYQRQLAAGLQPSVAVGSGSRPRKRRRPPPAAPVAAAAAPDGGGAPAPAPAAAEAGEAAAPPPPEGGHGPEIIGCRVKMYWPRMKQWYAGDVTDYTALGKHHICYDDGDEILTDLRKERYELLTPPNPQTAGGGGSAAPAKRARRPGAPRGSSSGSGAEDGGAAARSCGDAQAAALPAALAAACRGGDAATASAGLTPALVGRFVATYSGLLSEAQRAGHAAFMLPLLECGAFEAVASCMEEALRCAQQQSQSQLLQQQGMAATTAAGAGAAAAHALASQQQSGRGRSPGGGAGSQRRWPGRCGAEGSGLSEDGSVREESGEGGADPRERARPGKCGTEQQSEDSGEQEESEAEEEAEALGVRSAPAAQAVHVAE